MPRSVDPGPNVLTNLIIEHIIKIVKRTVKDSWCAFSMKAKRRCELRAELPLVILRIRD